MPGSAHNTGAVADVVLTYMYSAEAKNLLCILTLWKRGKKGRAEAVIPKFLKKCCKGRQQKSSLLLLAKHNHQEIILPGRNRKKRNEKLIGCLHHSAKVVVLEDGILGPLVSI